MAEEKNFFQKLIDTPDTTDEYEEEDIQQNKTMGILAYLFWLVLIPLFARKGSKYVRFHVNQGLILSICWTAVAIVCSILSMIPYVGWLFAVIEYILSLAFTGLAVFGIVFVAKGRARELPLIGKYRILK